MQFLIEAAKWLVVASVVVTAIALVVFAVFTWLLTRPDPS